MSTDSCIDLVPVTPDYFLAVERDLHRQCVRFDFECDPQIDLTLDSTIDEWRSARDLVGTRRLGRALNELWGLRLADCDWVSVLSPSHSRALRDVAELIARHATRPKLRPLAIAGTRCLPAAAFLAIRDVLAREGADVSNLAPSTPLSEFACRYPTAFLCEVARFAPGAMPEVRFHASEDTAALSIGWIAWLCWAVGMIGARWIEPAKALAVISLFLQMLLWFRSKFDNSESLSVEFGELRTFRDLAKCVAAGAM